MEKQNNNFQESLEFVSTHYRKDAFDINKVRKNIGIPSRMHFSINRPLITAASVAAIVLTAAAAVYFMNPSESDSLPTTKHQQTTSSIKNNVETYPETAVLEFTDTSLSEIVDKIESTYGVRVTGLPTDTSMHLTLCHEGTAQELIEILNELLSTNMQAEKK